MAKSYPSRTVVHPKLEMTEPGDADEREADAAAHDVMSGKVFRKFSGGGAGGGMAVSSQMESQLNQLQGGGQTMPDGLRGMMERGFDRDFSQVRLHTDGEAAGLSSSIHAKAFTHGNDIYFNQGQYAPETSEGQRLVAHELAHVAQGGGKVGREPEPTSFSSYDDFVSDDSWILDEESRRKLKRNYRQRNGRNRKPLTVFLYTTKAEGLAAFGESENQLFRDFIRNESRTRVLMIQGLSSLNEYIRALRSMTEKYGPLQNVVLMGHGSHNIVSLGNGVEIDTSEKSEEFYTTVRQLFEEADKLVGRPLPHSFLMPGCLTGVNVDTPKGLANYVKTKLGNGVLVLGNKASVNISKESFCYSDLNVGNVSGDYLSFINNFDEDSPVRGRNKTPITKTSDSSYRKGHNVKGILYEINKSIVRYSHGIIDGDQFPPNVDYPIKGGIFINVMAGDVPMKFFYMGKDIMDQVIKPNIVTNLQGVENFINYVLFDFIPFNLSQTPSSEPSLQDLFDASQTPTDNQRASWESIWGNFY